MSDDPPLDESGLAVRGFAGFVTFDELLTGGLADVPDGDGVYVVVRTLTGPPSFLGASLGGRHKGKDPTIPMDTLEAKWVDDAVVLYVGRAPRNAKGERGLRTRVGEYAKFGAGRNIGHWGGRYIWQLEEQGTLLVAWRECSEGHTAAGDEAELVSEFRRQHGGRLPFANIASVG